MDPSPFLTPLEARKQWEQLSQKNESNSNLNNSISSPFGSAHEHQPPRPESKRRIPSGSITENGRNGDLHASSHPEIFKKPPAPVPSSRHNSASGIHSTNTSSSIKTQHSTALTYEGQESGSSPVLAPSIPKKPTHTTKPSISAKPKPLISKKPAHLSVKPPTESQSSTLLHQPEPVLKITKPAPPPPSSSSLDVSRHHATNHVTPSFQPPIAIPPPVVSRPRTPKIDTKPEIGKKPDIRIPEKKAFLPPPEIHPKSLDNNNNNNNTTEVVYVNVNPSTKKPIPKFVSPPPHVPISSHPLLNKESVVLSVDSNGKSLDTRPASADVNQPGVRSSSVSSRLQNSTHSTFVPPPAIPPSGNSIGSSTLVTNAFLVPPVPPSRPVTPVSKGPLVVSPGRAGQPSLPQQHVNDIHQQTPVSTPTSETVPSLPDPTSFLPPPRHHIVHAGSLGPEPSNNHMRVPSHVGLPPPLPLHHPKPSIPAPNGNEHHAGSEIKLSVSPAPPPPPSRKSKSPVYNTELHDPNASTQAHITSTVVPSRSFSQNHLPIVYSQNELAHPAPAHTTHPAAILPYAGPPTHIPLPSATANPVGLTAPLTSLPVHSPLPDPASFPPPPQRGDYFSVPPRRISESATSVISSPANTMYSNSTVGSQATLVMPPPVRRNTVAPAQFGNGSTVSLNSDHHSSGPEEGVDDSDEASPGFQGNGSDILTSYPDFSQANRRAPIFGGPLHEVSSKGKVDAIGFYGTTVCISSSSGTTAMDILTGEKIWHQSHSDTKITAIEFKPEKDATMRGRILWLGTKEGHIWEVDLYSSGIRQKRVNVHMYPIIAIQAVGDTLWTISEDGKICIWDAFINDTPKVFRMTPHFKACCVTGDHVWLGKNRQVSAYHPSLSHTDAFNITARPIQCPPLPMGKSGGDFTCAARVQKYPDWVFFGHEDGTITVFSRSKGAAVETINIAIGKITSLAGVGSNLWIGTNTGVIYVADIGVKPWKIIKEWKAHDSAVRNIVSNEDSFFSSPQMSHMPVVSVGSEQGVLIWDGLLKTDWIENDMNNHDSEFCTFQDISMLYVTWNAGAAKPSDLDRKDHDRMFLSTAFNRACPDYKNGPEIIVFGFQELVELDNRSVAAKTMFKTKKDKKEKNQKVATSTHISHQYKDWQDRLGREIAGYFKDNYNLVHSSNMVGLFTCVYVRVDKAPRIRSIKSGKTKTGLGGFHGNKGGIAVRLMVDDSSICFVNCHLAAGQNHTLNRNKDIETILETPFLDDSDNSKYIGKGIFANGGNGAMILDHEFCFFAGDMNYRINLHRPTAIQMIQDNDYPRLLDADQLILQLKKNPSHRLRSFQEAKINFPPTYKFDVGTDTYDTSEKRRVPAWCDRIYYKGRDNRVIPIDYGNLAVRVSDHKPVMGFYTLKVKTIDPSLRKDVYKDSLNRWQQYLNSVVEDLAQYYKSALK